ncbi:MAG: hypothetical protein HBSAPP03_17370 [Phycisphaerae bacterium]|nr:MAG: hypothetical protein HBSAPP03_17370 [Phycisphaerae bacterium]
MTPIAVLFTILAAVAGLVLAVILVVYLVVPVFKGLAWLVRHVARFIWGMISDTARFIGAVLLAILYLPLILGNIVIGRWSASGHYGRQFMHEVSTMGTCLYRVAIGHPLRLIGLGGVVEGVENRLPAAIEGAPTADLPSGGRVTQFEGYRIVGSLAPGGSGAKLYIAEIDGAKRQQLAKAGQGDVDRAVIKSFSLHDGSSLPQIVRESRSLDAAKKLGLILDHHLTPDRFYYVMRYVPGEPLSAMTKTLHASSPAGGLNEAGLHSALSYASDLVATLAAYHRGGLWHKDVKPDNVIVDEHGRAHLVDFGLVTSLRSAMTLTTHGTEYFRDPEMVRLALRGVKVHEVDGTKFDIYGAGAVLYATVEDSFPAHGVLSQVTRRCPESVKWIIRRAMSEYDKRYGSADEMLADLEAVRTAKDPYAVRVADLPSVRGNFPPRMPEETGSDSAASVIGVAAAATPEPPRATPATPPMPGSMPKRRTAPVLRVTGWWSGATEVVGQREHAVPTGTPVAQAAKMAQDGARAVGDAARGAWAGVAAAATPARPMGASPGRRTASEQLAAARARVEARRSRTHGVGARGGKSAGSGFNGGVAAALLIFVGALGGLAILSFVNEPSRLDSLAQTVENEVDGAASRLEAGVERAGARIEQAGERVASRMEQATSGKRTGRGTRPEASPPAQPAKVEGTVLVVSDVLQPWHETASGRIEDVTNRLRERGLTLRGNLPGSTATREDLDTIASVRLAMGETPRDGDEAQARVRGWLATRPTEADAVVWIVPSPIEGDPMPRVYVYQAEGAPAARSDALRTATATPPKVAAPR